jgi:nucleoside phosphorylase
MATADQLRALLDETAFRVLELLAASSSPVSGRALARSAKVSPTTASAALALLKRAGFANSIEAGRATTWYLDENSQTIRSWLDEGRRGDMAGGSGERPLLTAVILTALQEEYAAAIAHLPKRQSGRAGTTRFEVGTFEGDRCDWKVFVGEIGPGNATAAIEFVSAVDIIKPQLVLFVGVAGSVKPDDAGRGDVVVADRVYNVHSGKDAWSDTEGSVHRARPLSYPAAHGAVQLARSVRQRDWTAELGVVSPGIAVLNSNGKTPRVEIRAIAAGEVVHSDDRSELMEKVREVLNDVAAVDMESFGVYESAHIRQLPALAVRGISDCVGDKQPALDAVWQPRAASHAAAFAFALLRRAEPEDLPAAGSRPPPPEGQPIPETTSPRELLFRLPPPVTVVYEWAVPVVGARAIEVLNQLASLGGQPATWLSRFRHRTPALYKEEDSGPLWILVAEFADSHEHPSAAWLYEQAADRSADSIERSFLYARAAIAAHRDQGTDAAEELLAKAEAEEPGGRLLWEHHRAAFRSDVAAVLASTRALAAVLALGFAQPVIDAMGTSATSPEDEGAFSAYVSEFAERHSALLEQVRLHVALTAGSALQLAGKLNAAQMLFDGLVGGLPPYGTEGGTVLSALVGSRTSTILLQIARTLLARVANLSSREPGFDADAALARAVELALTARDRRLDWYGPTGDAVAIAAHARARSGDTRGALRLLLPPPLGTARPAEASSEPVVQFAAELAVGTGNVELALEFAAKIKDPVERRIATALALTLRPDSHPEAATEIRAALGEPAMSERIDQQIRALLALAMVATLSDDEFARLEKLDPEIADVIRAQSFMTAGRTSEAQILARRYPDNDAAVQIRAEGLMSQGKVAEAVGVLETHGARHGEERLIVQAATIALTSGLTEEANRLAALVASSIDPSRRRMSGEIIIDAASRRSDWDRVLRETRRLLEDESIAEADPDRDVSVIKYRWARVHAFHQRRQMDQAYEVVRAQPRLDPTEVGQAQLVASLLRSIAPSVTEAHRSGEGTGEGVTQAEVLSFAIEIAQAYPEDEELVATALMASLAMPADDPPDPVLMTKARMLQQQFFDSFPDSQIIRTVPIDEALSGVTEMLRTHLAPTADASEQMRRGAIVGQIPISVYTSGLQRSYAEGLIRNAVGCYVLQGTDDLVTAEEIEAARRALDGSVVVDTSALFLAEAVFGSTAELKSRFEHLLVTAPQRDDIVATRMSLMVRSAGSLGWDPVSDRPTMVHFDEEVTERWAKDAERLAAELSRCEVVPDPLYDGDARNRLWSSPVRLAAERGISILADDAALRAVARNEGVTAFGSLQLLSALVVDGALTPNALEEAYGRLMKIRAAELPLFERLFDLASEEGWKPNGYAGFLLTRPSTWVPLSRGLETYIGLVRALPSQEPDNVAGWFGAALFGLCLTTPVQTVPLAAGTLIAWTSLELRRPETLPVLLAQAEGVVGQFVRGVDLLREVVQRLVATIRQVSPPELVAGVVLALLAGLDEETHTKAVRHFLEAP